MAKGKPRGPGSMSGRKQSIHPIQHSSRGRVVSVVGITFSVLPLALALFGCTERNEKVILSDQTGTRTLVYESGKAFIPQAKTPEDISILVHSLQLTIADARKENDMLTLWTLKRAGEKRDFRTIERTVVEFRFRQIQKSLKDSQR